MISKISMMRSRPSNTIIFNGTPVQRYCRKTMSRYCTPSIRNSCRILSYLCPVGTATLTDIRSLTLEQLKSQLSEMGEQAFRAKQIYGWIWQKAATDFDQMSNLSKVLREKLKERFIINYAQVKQSQISNDKTIKSSFVLFDGNIIEGVLIPTPDRMTACVSSQVGCSLTCKFCATG